MSRTAASLIASLAIFVGAVGYIWWIPAVDRAELVEIRGALTAHLEGWLAEGELARADGYIYTVDVAQLLNLWALRGEEARFKHLTRRVLPLLWRDDPSDPYTRGFVPWRFKAGEAPDASGTTEALRLAEALWRGAARFEHPPWARQAVIILEGYCRHAYTERSVWLVRNYFNFETRAFANDSFLVDYHPDLLAEVARAPEALLRVDEGEGAEAVPARRHLFHDTAERSYAVVRRAQGASGLFRSLIQPDVSTLIPERDLTFFAPDGVVQLNNSCVIAEGVVVGDPEVARRFLDFSIGRLLGLKRYYDVNSGIARGDASAGIASLSCVARLAARLGDEEAMRRATQRAAQHWRTTLKHGVHAPKLYTAGEALLALEILLSRVDEVRAAAE